ncbi:MAG: CbiX/SirB N-terminal domain-containing protein [Cyanobacteria bacterium P01_H01_bin.74]
MTQQKQLILLAHGSRDERWKAPFEKLLAQLQQKFTQTDIYLAYMEMTTPTLNDAIQQAIQYALKSTETQPGTATMPIDILPLFMASGGHLRHDVPNLVAAAGKENPQVALTVLPPIGEHPQVALAIENIIAERCQ